MMVYLNGVHVEAQGLLSITTAVTLAVAFIMLLWGAPSPQQHADLKTDEVRALCVGYCVTSFLHLLLSITVLALCLFFFFFFFYKIDQ